MRRPELDYLLTAMLDSQPDVSDLLFTVNKPLQVEAFGDLLSVSCEPAIERLTPFQTEMIALNVMGDNQWHIGDYLRHGSCDTAYTLTDRARFRINIFSQLGNTSIVTLEDPVEFVHSHAKATFNQRELGTDFDNFANGLRAALRQAPKVILVGEMRDKETVKIALSAAETGHLVLSTLHTIDAGQTI